MAPIPQVPSTEPAEEDAAFRILNRDDLPMAIIGRPILKPFGTDKPNLVVRPTRRDDKKSTFDESGGDPFDSNRKSLNDSRGYLRHYNSLDQAKRDELTDIDELEHFTKVLDSKLKRLQKEETKLKKKTTTTVDAAPATASCKKPFVTTVKKGQFLEPPPELATLIGIKTEESKRKIPKENGKLYAFASRPRVLSRTPPKNVHQTRCEAAAWAAAKLVGTVVGVRQEEPRIIRNISTQKQQKKLTKDREQEDQPKWNPHFAYAKLLSRDDIDSATRLEQARRRALARKKAKRQQIKGKEDGSSLSPTTCDAFRDRLLDLQRILVVPEKTDVATQTDETDQTDDDDVFFKCYSDAQIQVHPTDLFDFNTQVRPIVEVLVGKTIEEALVEVLEEEELAAMKEQQRRFLEYVAQKTGEDSIAADTELLKNLSKVVKHNYVPNFITSV
ncbi:unnamed protein product [Phyllotreta striolata]|uniref:Uncharacterized protein n=1 Tax=Phyllotreta striolata TaxID=444603 RepID=A0A9N9T9H3_PHYSR|nr:unnamed protein product [Phyllotreta striolata]